MRKLLFLLLIATFLNASYVLKPDNLQDIQEENNLDLRFESLKSRVFSYVAKDMNNIIFNSKSLKTDLKFEKFIDGINIIWLLPDEFSEFVNENYEIFSAPKTNLEGELSVILKMQKDGKIIREEALTSPFKIILKD